MVLSIPGALFEQTDVRETPSDKMVQANFNTTDFNVDANGIVNLKNKTSYWSCAGYNFVSDNATATGNNKFGYLSIDAAATTAMTRVTLPHGAIVTRIDSYSENADPDNYTIELIRSPLGTLNSNDVMGSATGITDDLNDTSITNATIDNNTYIYFIVLSGMDANFTIHGAKVTYTTDYD